jgi:parallel beta-helix repeat protein
MSVYSTLFAILFVFLPFFLLALPAEGAEKTIEFYVSPAGNDGWSGKKKAPNKAKTDGPFATITRARDAIRSLGWQARKSAPIKVVIRGGVYQLAEPIVFLPEDSGTKEHPITYQAYRSEKPIISGGRKITNWKQAEGDIWKAQIPEVKEGKWYFRQLFVNGRRAQRARLPKTGFYYVDGAMTEDAQAQFKFHDQDLQAKWAEQGDVEIIALQAWAESRMHIAAVDTSQNLVRLSGKPSPYGRESNARYWVENVPDAIEIPGEWYLDRRTGEVSYLPLPDEDIAKAEVIAPGPGQLIRFEGKAAAQEPVGNIHLRGLTFAHTDWKLSPIGYADQQAAYDIPAAIEANGATAITIEKCTFTHLGNYAIAFGKGCKYNLIRANEISDVGAGGIKIGEPKVREAEAEQTGDNKVTDNHIYDIGIVYPGAVGVWVGQSGGNTISHNHIHDTYYTGISVGWTWGYGPALAKGNIIEYNDVHDIGRGMLSDMGGIYTLGMQPGTVIRNNLFHDVNSYGYGGWGIYTDEGSTGILIENNLVYNTKTGGFHQHYGRENIIRNNIFAFAREGQIIRTRMEPHLSFTFEHNIVFWKEGPLLGSNWSDEQYRLDYNLYFEASGAPVKFQESSFAEWQAKGQDKHSLIADPLFIAPDKNDFRLKPGSPALKLGFKPIDMSKVGPRRQKQSR